MTTERKDGRLWLCTDIDDNSQPCYGPFPSQEAADAFGMLLGHEQHSYHVEELVDPESVRLKLIERLARYELETVPRLDEEAKK